MRISDWSSDVCSSDLLSIVGNITCVSDVGLDRQNPFTELGGDVSWLARKYRLKPNHFRYDFAGEKVGQNPKQRSVWTGSSRQRVARESVRTADTQTYRPYRTSVLWGKGWSAR